MARLNAKSSKNPPMARLTAKSSKTPPMALTRHTCEKMEIETENGTSEKIHTACLEIRDTVEMPRDLRDLSPNIPVIDFSLLASGSEGERRRINPPAKEWGFFQIINHEVAEDIVRIIKSAMA
ncbi:hypothetical protein ACMD2_14482, partial [Ananas comosus]